MNDKISVIVPVYNVEPYLERCLDSIINNTYQNLEIICVNDGSTDGSGAILDRYAQKDSRIQVITQDNGGLSAARNSGMDAATGEFIAFVDSDDWIHPQYFEILLDLQKRENCDVAICGYARPQSVEEYITYNVSEIKGRSLDLEGIYQDRNIRSYVWRKLYQRDLVQGKRFLEGIKIAEDAVFDGLVFGSKEHISGYYTQIPLYFYFDRPGSLVYSLRERELLALSEIFGKYADDAVNSRTKRVFLIETMKRGLSARYPLSLKPEEKAYVVRCNRVLHKAVKQLCRQENVSIKEKLQYLLFVYVPSSYRLFRIMDDPTLLAMEKNMKKKVGENNE